MLGIIIVLLLHHSNSKEKMWSILEAIIGDMSVNIGNVMRILTSSSQILPEAPHHSE